MITMHVGYEDLKVFRETYTGNHHIPLSTLTTIEYQKITMILKNNT
jgi:hypothetical protein